MKNIVLTEGMSKSVLQRSDDTDSRVIQCIFAKFDKNNSLVVEFD